MADIIVLDARIVIKRSTQTTVVPTIPSTEDFTDPAFLVTDILSGEFFINEVDEIGWVRTGASIKQFLFKGDGEEANIYTEDGVIADSVRTIDVDGNIVLFDDGIFRMRGTGNSNSTIGLRITSNAGESNLAIHDDGVALVRAALGINMQGGDTSPNDLIQLDNGSEVSGGIRITEEGDDRAWLRFLSNVGGVLQLYDHASSSVRTLLSGETAGVSYINAGNNNGKLSINSSSSVPFAPIHLLVNNPSGVTHTKTLLVSSGTSSCTLRVHGTGNDGFIIVNSWNNATNPQNYRMFRFGAYSDAGDGYLTIEGLNDDDVAGKDMASTGVRQEYMRFASDEIVVNNAQNDVNVRVKTDNADDTLFIDGGNDNVGMGTDTPEPDAILDLTSTTKAFMPPRMTATQASAISASNGMMLYVTDTDATFTSVGFWGYENGAWVKL